MSTLSEMKLLASTSISSDTATVSFSDLPSTYDHLHIFYNIRSNTSSASTLRYTLNNITTTSYNGVSILSSIPASGSSTLTSSGSVTTKAAFLDTSVITPNTNWSANYFTVGHFRIHGYSKASLYKAAFVESDTSPNAAQATSMAYHWGQQDASNAAITSIQFSLSAGSFVAGSSFHLFAIKG